MHITLHGVRDTAQGLAIEGVAIGTANILELSTWLRQRFCAFREVLVTRYVDGEFSALLLD
jgi:hypothetical protein